MKKKVCPPKIKRESWPKISMRMRLKWWGGVYFPKCGICRHYICSWEDLVPDHIQPGKMGGCKDNSESNLQPAHVRCNIEKGSKRLERLADAPERNTRHA